VNDDADLLERARHLDQEALGTIYDLFSPGIYRYALRQLGTEALAEDCVAEVFSRFLHAISKGGGPQEYLKSYLYRIAHNWITDQFRRQPVPDVPYEAELLGDADANPSRLTAEKLEQEQVRHMLRLLTPDQRQVIVLKYYQDFSNQEVAEALEKPVSAVKSLQHRALAALKRMLLNEEKIDEPI
jgi:RNA polymerase sigma-70 factor (ECF subfamily)